MRFASESDIYDERLWMPIARATGALGNTSCLVGTPEQVAEAILKELGRFIEAEIARWARVVKDNRIVAIE